MGTIFRYLIYLIYLHIAIILTTIDMVNATPTVEVTAPLNPVENGGVLGVHCQVRNLDAGHEVTILRTLGNDVHRLSSGEGVTHSTEDRVFLAPRQLADGSMVYFLSVMEVTRADEGVYSCRVVNMAEGSTVATDSVTLNVMYFPSDSDPSCTPSEPLTLLEGTTLSFNCSSEAAYPHVSLSWTRGDTDDKFQTKTGAGAGRVYSALSLTVLREHHKAVFLCHIHSVAFQSIQRTCHVGPLTVIPNREFQPETNAKIPGVKENNNALVTKTPDNLMIPTQDLSNKDQVECSQLCSTMTSSNDAFFWIVATIVGAVLAVTFFVMGIVLLVKYCRLPENPTSTYVAVQQPSHDIYAELDGRRCEGKVYMTLEQVEKTNRLIEIPQDKVHSHYDVMPNLPKL